MVARANRSTSWAQSAGHRADCKRDKHSEATSETIDVIIDRDTADETAVTR